MKKKITLLFAMLAVCLSGMADELTVGDTFTSTDGNLLYTVLAGGTSVSVKAAQNVTGAINIDPTVTHDNTTYTVTEIADQGFYDNSTGGRNITSITLPNTLTKIGLEAFKSCGNLESVEIPASVTVLGDACFNDCWSLASITIADGATELASGKYKIIYDHYLVETIGETQKLIRYFNDDTTPVTVPTSITQIGAGSLSGEDFTAITLHNGITSIGYQAFFDCLRLASIKIPASVVSIGNEAFYCCSALTAVTFESMPSFEGQFVFQECSNLTTVNVPAEATESYISELTSKGMETDIIKSYNYELKEGENYVLTTAETKNITYTRNFANDNWQALFLPFEVTEAEWSAVGQVAELTGYDATENTLTWTEKSSGNLTAGKPYIIKPGKFISNEDLEIETVKPLSVTAEKALVANTQKTEVEVGPEGNKVKLCGTYAEMTMNDELEGGKCYWGLSHGDFYYTDNAEKKLKPYRIYLIAPKPSGGAPQSAPMKNRIVGAGTTEIVDVEFSQPSDAQPVNIFGQPVGEDYKGIVIVNGKKVIRK